MENGTRKRLCTSFLSLSFSPPPLSLSTSLCVCVYSLFPIAWCLISTLVNMTIVRYDVFGSVFGINIYSDSHYPIESVRKWKWWMGRTRGRSTRHLVDQIALIYSHWPWHFTGTEHKFPIFRRWFHGTGYAFQRIYSAYQFRTTEKKFPNFLCEIDTTEGASLCAFKLQLTKNIVSIG